MHMFLILFISPLDGRLSYSYLCYKIVLSGYIVSAYILSHLNYYWKEKDSNNIQCYVNQTDDGKSNQTSTETSSSWPYYFLYLSNWCFTVFVFSFLLDASLVLRRYIKENKRFDNVADLEKW